MFTQTMRRQFLQYFKEHRHVVLPSSPVVPHDDPTLLFTNAGMNQFKDVFLGKSHRDYTRATTSQKCIRVGGKHNDLENVGHTTRHLTFFEMLGNFSFGDYFKAEAIRFAWEASTNVFGFDPTRIWPTVFIDDDEAFELWTQYVPAERITRFGEKENFWAMGDVGPCGPCSELLYDRGPQFGQAINPSQDPSGERFLEFWNLVFMQYNRQPSGAKDPLPRPSIDTGAGLERVMNLKLGVKSVFETDILRSLIARVEEISKLTYQPDNKQAPAFQVIADHLRCLSFAMADGVQPGNSDRGYVLRKVLRRAVRYGRALGMEKPFLADVLPQLIETMGDDYPELVKSQARIAEILTLEEEGFIRTLKRGGNMLNQVIEQAQKSSAKTISGQDAFKLKDTYGLPFEEIQLIAKDSDLTIDEDLYQALEEEARQRSRHVHKNVQQVASDNIFSDFIKENGETTFFGYTHISTQGSVLGLLVDGQFVDRLEEGQEALILLSQTPFYAEMGGQVGDTGQLESPSHLFLVTDCVSPYKGLIAHKGQLTQGRLKIGDSTTAVIDQARRQKIANNHTATHLLHWALHKVLGEHIKQAGSVVDPQRLRFDFSHHKALSAEELRRIEDLINHKIRANQPVEVYELHYEDALKRDDIKQFFGEKYGARVRVVDLDFSKELCGGTHTSASGTIGLFKIAKEASIAAGIRRIEAVTGEEAEQLVREQEDVLIDLARSLKIQPPQLPDRLEKLIEENKTLAQELKTLKKHNLNQLIDTALSKQEKIGTIPALILDLPITVEDLRLCVDQAADKLQSGVIVLATRLSEKCQLMIKISDDFVSKGLSANEIVKLIAPIIEGNGGGKQNAAQVGGKSPQHLTQAFDVIRRYLTEKQ